MKKLVYFSVALLFHFSCFTTDTSGETIEEAILRSGSVIVSHNVSPVLITGNTYHITWKVQSYVNLKSKIQVIYADGTKDEVVGNLESQQPSSYSMGDYQSYWYQFSADYIVPENREGIAIVGFCNTKNDGGASLWMYGIFPSDVIDIPELISGKQFQISICKPGENCKIFSPVEGKFKLIDSDQKIYDKWKFNQHQTIGHKEKGGIGKSDDTYAWDINLNREGQSDTDHGRPVYAVAPGVLPQQYAGQTNGGKKGKYGQVVISHDNGSWFSGYLHLENITVNAGDTVDQNTVIGYVGNKGTGNNHLHFVVYTGTNESEGLTSFDADFMERLDLASRHHR